MGKRSRRKKCRTLRVRFTTLISFLLSRSVILIRLFLPRPARTPPPPLFSFPLPVSSVRPAAASVPLPPVARLLIRGVSEDEGSSVAKKFGYFATLLVNKLRHAHTILVRRQGSQPGRREMQFKAQFPPAALPPSRPLSVKLISAAPAQARPGPVPGTGGRARAQHSIPFSRPRFHECLSDCRNFWGAVSVRPSTQSPMDSSLARSVGVCRALLEFQ